MPQRKVVRTNQQRINQQQVTGDAKEFGIAIADAQAREDALRKHNDQFKQKIATFQDKLDEIADLASAPADGSEYDQDELIEHLNAILDIAAPGSTDDDEDDEDTDS
jgi:hypothetical protein